MNQRASFSTHLDLKQEVYDDIRSGGVHLEARSAEGELPDEVAQLLAMGSSWLLL